MTGILINGAALHGIEAYQRVNVIAGAGVTLSAKHVARHNRLDLTVAAVAANSADFAGTAFPASPYGGQAFYRTELGDLFAYTGAKWLSVRTTEATYTNGTTLSSGAVMRLFQGPNGTTALGYRLMWDATLVEVIASRATSGASTAYGIRAGSTAKITHTLGAGVVTSNEATDVDFSANDVVNILMGSDMTGGGTCTAIFRRRAS